MPTPRPAVRIDAIKMVCWQFAVVTLLAILVFLFQSAQNGISILFGGVAYCLPNFIFVWRVFSHATAREARQFLAAFVLGELAKLFISAVLVVIIVKLLPVRLIGVLIGYIAAIVAFWIVSFITMAQEQGEVK